MTQQSHCLAYTLRKPKLRKIHVTQYQLQHYLQQPSHRNNLDSSAKEWIRSCGTLKTMEHYLAIKMSAFEPVLMRLMNQQPITESELSPKEKNKYCVLMHICGIQKDGTDVPICRAGLEMNIEDRFMDTGHYGESEMNGDCSMEIYIL